MKRTARTRSGRSSPLCTTQSYKASSGQGSTPPPEEWATTQRHFKPRRVQVAARCMSQPRQHCHGSTGPKGSSPSTSRWRSTTPNTEDNVVSAIGTAIRTASTLAAAASAGDRQRQGRERDQHGRGRADPARDVRGRQSRSSPRSRASAPPAPRGPASPYGSADPGPCERRVRSGPRQRHHPDESRWPSRTTSGASINGPTSGLHLRRPQGQIVGGAQQRPERDQLPRSALGNRPLPERPGQRWRRPLVQQHQRLAHPASGRSAQRTTRQTAIRV